MLQDNKSARKRNMTLLLASKRHINSWKFHPQRIYVGCIIVGVTGNLLCPLRLSLPLQWCNIAWSYLPKDFRLLLWVVPTGTSLVDGLIITEGEVAQIPLLTFESGNERNNANSKRRFYFKLYEAIRLPTYNLCRLDSASMLSVGPYEQTSLAPVNSSAPSLGIRSISAPLSS